MKTKKVHKRVWLQPGDPDTMSYVAYTFGKYDHNVTIADCHRSITIGFYNAKSVKKLDKLIATLTEFRELLGEKGENIRED